MGNKGLSLIVHGLCEENKIPEPVDEYYFAKPRRWRFDFCWTEVFRPLVAMEVEGGVWIVGRHVRGGGYVKDLEKYNQATLLGWRLLRYTPAQIRSGAWVQDVRQILGLV